MLNADSYYQSSADPFIGSASQKKKGAKKGFMDVDTDTSDDMSIRSQDDTARYR